MLKVKVGYTEPTTSKMIGPESDAKILLKVALNCYHVNCSCTFPEHVYKWTRHTGPTTSKMTGPESDAQGEGKIHWTNYF
jgi:3',5'-cyclic AMP phosphodiesterase CpdA